MHETVPVPHREASCKVTCLSCMGLLHGTCTGPKLSLASLDTADRVNGIATWTVCSGSSLDMWVRDRARSSAETVAGSDVFVVIFVV